MAKLRHAEFTLLIGFSMQNNLDISASSAIQYVNLLIGFSLKEDIKMLLNVVEIEKYY